MPALRSDPLLARCDAPPSASDFDLRVRPHLDAMRAAARAILPSDDLAGDVVQETLLRVWLNGRLPPEPGPVMRHLARRGALHVLRGLRRRHTHEERAAVLGCPACETSDPLVALERVELGEVLRRALARLGRDQRRVLELADLRGLAYGEIARREAVPIGTVRSRLSRARRALRAQLEELLPGLAA